MVQKKEKKNKEGPAKKEMAGFLCNIKLHIALFTPSIKTFLVPPERKTAINQFCQQFSLKIIGLKGLSKAQRFFLQPEKRQRGSERRMKGHSAYFINLSQLLSVLSFYFRNKQDYNSPPRSHPYQCCNAMAQVS